MCRFFSVSRSGYYDFVKRMDRPAKDRKLAKKIKECQIQTGQTYGYRRVAIWLERSGIHHNPKNVLRIMRKYSLLSVIRRKRYYRYIRTAQGFLYLSVIRDLYSALWHTKHLLFRM